MKFEDLKKGMELRLGIECVGWGYRKKDIIIIDSNDFDKSTYGYEYGKRIKIKQKIYRKSVGVYVTSGYYLTEKAFYECKMKVMWGYQTPLWRVLNGEE